MILSPLCSYNVQKTSILLVASHCAQRGGDWSLAFKPHPPAAAPMHQLFLNCTTFSLPICNAVQVAGGAKLISVAILLQVP
jgi:hypothetical protein